jgi:dTDP-4-dehydrorhamnose reductase
MGGKLQMKIFVLGKNGMLGRYIYTYLKSKNYDVIGTTRDDFTIRNIYQSYGSNKIKFLDYFDNNISENDIVINCIGTIKPRVDQLGDFNAILINSLFPIDLANLCESKNVKLIHPTTDCVYSGLKGEYNEKDLFDVNDTYGLSKALGEPKNCTVIRTSIIGEEVNQTRSLVEWVKNNKDNTINGYTNHYWNGVTCLQFAKIIENLINNPDKLWVGTKHLYSNTVSKFDLLNLINQVYDLNITVNPYVANEQIDRSISTIYKDNLNYFNIPSLIKQRVEMQEYSSVLYNN